MNEQDKKHIDERDWAVSIYNKSWMNKFSPIIELFLEEGVIEVHLDLSRKNITANQATVIGKKKWVCTDGSVL